MSKYGALSRSEGHSKWFLQKTLLEHDKTMDHPWMQMIYKQVFSLKQYATWVAMNHAIFKSMEEKIRDEPPMSAVHDAALLRTKALEIDLRRLLGPNWAEETPKLCAASAATQQYLQSLEKDVASASGSYLLLAHHFLQYNAVLSGGSYLGKMVSEKLCMPHGAPGVKFYAFEGVDAGKEPIRVQRYLQDFDSVIIADEPKNEMLRVMKRIYGETETMMDEVFQLNPVKGISYKNSQDGQEAPQPVAPCAEQLHLTLEELQKYQGQDGGRILMSVGGDLLDVSAGREMYGPGGGYSLLAGHDVTRCLATMSLEPEHLDDLQWSPDSAEDEEALKNWQMRLKEKYPLAGKLEATSSEKAAEGLRQRKKLPDVSASGAPLEGSTEVKEGNSEDRCPISGKQGTCPMASIMGLAGVKPDAGTTASAPSTASVPAGSSFMKGKSLVASVQQKNSMEDSLFYRLCPLHWDDKTIKMVAMIAVASWMSGIFVGWNLRKMLAR